MGTGERLWTNNFLLITLANFILFTSFQMLLPSLPKYAAELGGGDMAAGLIIGIFTISAVVSRPYAGLLMDRHGRKGVLTAGFAVFLLSAFLYNFTFSVMLLLLLRLIHGLGWGFATTASGTVAADIVPAARRGEGLGYYGMSAVLSMAFAPAVGIFITENYTFSHLFIASTILAGLALIFTQGITFQPLQQKEQQVKPAILEPSSLRTSGVMFFLTFIYGGIVTFIALYAGSLGITNVGLFFTMYSFVLLAVRPIAGRLSDKKGTDLVVIPGLIVMIAGVILLGLARELSYFLASGMLVGLGFGAVQPSLHALTIKLAPLERRGAANATFYSAFDLGIGTGSIILGTISALFGYTNMYLFSSFSGVIGLVLYMKLLYGEKGGRVLGGEQK